MFICINSKEFIFIFFLITSTSYGLNTGDVFNTHNFVRNRSDYKYDIDCPVLKRMRYTALSKGRSPTPEPLSGHLLRGGHIFHGRLRRFRAGHLALAALHGRHDLHRADRPADTSKRRDLDSNGPDFRGKKCVFFFCFFFPVVRTAGVHLDGEAKTRRFLLVSSGALREARGRLQHDASSRHDHGFPKRVLRTSVTTG